MLTLVVIISMICMVMGDTSKVCKCDGVKCGEVKLLSSLVPLATKWAGVKEGGCEQYGYTERTGEVLKVKTPIGTIESPVYVKKVTSDLKKRLTSGYRNSYISKIRRKSAATRRRPLKPAPVIDGPPTRTFCNSRGGRKVYSVSPRITSTFETFTFRF